MANESFEGQWKRWLPNIEMGVMGIVHEMDRTSINDSMSHEYRGDIMKRDTGKTDHVEYLQKNFEKNSVPK